MTRRNAGARSTRNRRRGFTLTELMVVIVIIGILAGGIVVGYQVFVSDARYTDATKTIRAVVDFVNHYQTKKGKYPTDLEEINTTYDQKIPPKDPWDRDWIFEAREDGFYFGSEGKVEGPGDDIFYDSEEGKILDERDKKAE